MTDIVTSVVDAVADADGVDPAEMDPLYEYIDPDILVKLGEQEDSGRWQFTFQYSDHQIILTHDGQILVDGVSHTTDLPTE